MKQRLIGAIIVLIIFIPLFLIGEMPFKIFTVLIAILSMREIINLKKEIPFIMKILSYISVGLVLMINIELIFKLLILSLVYYIPIVFIDNKKYNIDNATYLYSFSIFFTIIYSYVDTFRNFDINILIYLLLITILTDTFAYVGGKLFGKHKLIERVSPNKTIEGSIIGSLFGTVIPSIFYIYMISPGSNFILVIVLTLILSIIGQIGDLIFSSIKRYYKIKDFSNLIPGHGGILDRLDSIIFVIIGYILLINIF